MNGLHISGSEVYQRDIATLKKYREDYYKITLHKQIRRAGYEAIEGEADSKHRGGKKNAAEGTGKLSASLSRTRAAIFELALCNNWEWFVSLTLNPQKFDRADLKTYKKKLSIFIKNYNRIHNTNIKYLLIPELHEDRINYHMHGLMMGLPVEHLREFTEQERLPIRILIELKKGRKVYTWEAYGKTFGYITVTEIRHLESVSRYITKYVTKDLAKTRIGLNDHLYYCSQGLKRSELIYIGQLTKELGEEYSNEYVKIKTVPSFDEAIAYFVDG